MIHHLDLGKSSFTRSKTLHQLIHNQAITMAGNQRLKIYGTLDCKSGKRMKPENRVFFKNETEAMENSYRPCGHCMREKYKVWKERV